MLYFRRHTAEPGESKSKPSRSFLFPSIVGISLAEYQVNVIKVRTFESISNKKLKPTGCRDVDDVVACDLREVAVIDVNI